MTTKTMLKGKFKVLTDSDVYQEGQGYERVMIVRNWHRLNPTKICQVTIRVDRNPSESFARVAVWVDGRGWNQMAVIPPREFWRDMPGYLRWSNDSSDTKTAQLAGDLVEELVKVAPAIFTMNGSI